MTSLRGMAAVGAVRKQSVYYETLMAHCFVVDRLLQKGRYTPIVRNDGILNT